MRVLTISIGVVALVSVVVASAGAGQSVTVGARGGAAVTTPAPRSAEKPRSGSPTTVGANASASARVAANPVLAMRLRPLLPSGMTLQVAAEGFRTQGQFVAALHVANNLNIPFADLKADMIGEGHESLGASIHKRKATVDADAESKKAEAEAEADVKATANPTVSQRIAADATLSARLQPLLPAGTTVEAAAQGFRNEGQFCAAVHVSKNLGISLADLKTQLMGEAHDNLGQAIHNLKSDVDARAEALRAESEGKVDVEHSVRAQSKAEADAKAEANAAAKKE